MAREFIGGSTGSGALPGAAADRMPEWSGDSTPLQLVLCEDTGGVSRFSIGADAKRALLSAAGSRPVRAVAVSGLYRTGKSMLLNLLAGTHGSAASFAVGDSVRACTAGIWMRMSKPDEDGSVCLLLDCEGAGSTEKTRDHDARLFAIAVLISSLLVFNSRGVISDPAVHALATAASLAQHVQQQQEDKSSAVGLAPSFLWVLRDFTLQLENRSGEPISEQEYLAQVLGAFATNSRPPPDATTYEQWEDRREARQRIMDLFPLRDCATLVRPVEDEDQLQRLDKIPSTAFRPKFVEQVNGLRHKVFRACQPMRSPNGKVVNGGAFLALLDSCLAVFNQGAVPQLGSAWQQVSRQECGRAADEALSLFSRACLDLTAAIPMSDEDMEDGLCRATALARERFEAVAMGAGEVVAEYTQDLRNSMQERSQRIRQENDAVARRHNELYLRKIVDSMVDDLLKKYRPEFEAGALSQDECDKAKAQLEAVLEQMRASYNTQAVGPVAAQDVPFEQIALRRVNAANAEVASWRVHVTAMTKAAEEGQQAAAAKRAELELGGRALAEDIEIELKESERRRGKLRQTPKSPIETVTDEDAKTAIKEKMNLIGNGVDVVSAKMNCSQKACCVAQ